MLITIYPLEEFITLMFYLGELHRNLKKADRVKGDLFITYLL